MGQTLEFDDCIMVFGVFSNALYIDYISFYASTWYPNGAYNAHKIDENTHMAHILHKDGL